MLGSLSITVVHVQELLCLAIKKIIIMTSATMTIAIMKIIVLKFRFSWTIFALSTCRLLTSITDPPFGFVSEPSNEMFEPFIQGGEFIVLNQFLNFRK